jgi:RNA polymerase sigma factor (sigma-70 family)
MPLSIVEVVPQSGASNVDATANEGVAGFENVRHRLFGIAYQVLGRAADAEDIVQDVWVRWQGADRARVRDRVGFLVTVTRRTALNAATSARARREVSVGEWLPEHDAATIDPQLRAEHSEAIAVALDLLLARLSPVERAVYVLREAFAYPFREIGEALEISEANARQVARRARIHLAEQRHESVDSAERDELLESFLDAARAGNVAGLIDMLVNAVDTKSASTRCHAVLDRAKLRTSRPTVAVRARCATPADAAHPQR